MPPPPPPPPRFDDDSGPDRNEKGSNVVYNRLYSFAAEVSIIGARAIFDARRSIWDKIKWTVLVLFGLGLALYQIQDRLSYYFQYPTTASLDQQHNDQLDFPQVTICNENQILRSAAAEYGLVDVLQQMYPLSRLNVTGVPNLTVFNKWNWTDETIRSFNKNLSQPFPTGFTFCAYNGVKCSITGYVPQVKPLTTNIGECFTFNYAGVNLTASNVGTAHGLKMFLYVQQFDYLVTWGSFTAGFRVLIHDQKEVPLIRELAFKVPPGECASVAIAYSQNVQAAPPYGDCNNEQGYTESGCRLNCLSVYVVSKCGCRTDYMSGTAPLCSIVQRYTCADEAVNEFTSDPKGSVACQCRTQCVTNLYDYALSSSSFSALALDFVKDKMLAGYGLSAEAINSNMACLEVYFSTLNSVTISTDAAYGSMSLLSDIGGALGLLLGATLFTLVELAEFGVHLLRDVIANRRKSRTEELEGMGRHRNNAMKNEMLDRISSDSHNHPRVLSVISLDESNQKTIH